MFYLLNFIDNNLFSNNFIFSWVIATNLYFQNIKHGEFRHGFVDISEYSEYKINNILLKFAMQAFLYTKYISKSSSI